MVTSYWSIKNFFLKSFLLYGTIVPNFLWFYQLLTYPWKFSPLSRIFDIFPAAKRRNKVTWCLPISLTSSCRGTSSWKVRHHHCKHDNYVLINLITWPGISNLKREMYNHNNVCLCVCVCERERERERERENRTGHLCNRCLTHVTLRCLEWA